MAGQNKGEEALGACPQSTECLQTGDGLLDRNGLRGVKASQDAKLPQSADYPRNGKQQQNGEHPQDADSILAYVDGSYNHALGKYAFGCVFILADGRVYTESGNGNNPESAALRNVTGEMLGAMFAVRFALFNGFRRIEIRYDYEGIEKWVTGKWKSKTELTQKYAAAMKNWGNRIEISFQKVTAHSKVYYNEMADQLAKDALNGPDGVPPARSLEQMTPISEEK